MKISWPAVLLYGEITLHLIVSFGNLLSSSFKLKEGSETLKMLIQNSQQKGDNDLVTIFPIIKRSIVLPFTL